MLTQLKFTSFRIKNKDHVGLTQRFEDSIASLTDQLEPPAVKVL